jgi:hypothetical protein
MTRRVDQTERNAAIVRLREQKVSYKGIANDLGITVGVVNAVVRKCFGSGQLRRAGTPDPFAYVNTRAKTEGSAAGKVSSMCRLIGLDGVKWLWRTKPKDLTFAEYLGVIVKDVYLEEMGD